MTEWVDAMSESLERTKDEMLTSRHCQNQREIDLVYDTLIELTKHFEALMKGAAANG